MDLHQLRLLRELGERGSLAAVARAFHVSPSAVSQQLAALQRRVEVPLTERRGRTLVLTGAGQALAEAALQISIAMSSAERAVSRYVQDPAATVTVSAFSSAGLTYFGPLIRDLAGEGNPRLVCHDRDVGQDDFPALTADYDLVIAHRLEHSAPWPSSITALPLVREPLDIALSDQHRLAGEPTVSVTDLVDEQWVSVQDGFPPRPSIGKYRRPRKQAPPRHAPHQRVLHCCRNRRRGTCDCANAPLHRGAASWQPNNPQTAQ